MVTIGSGQQQACPRQGRYLHRHDRVDLYHDPSLFRPIRDLEYLIYVRGRGAVLRSSLLDIRLRVE